VLDDFKHFLCRRSFRKQCCCSTDGKRGRALLRDCRRDGGAGESADAESHSMEVAFYDPQFKARINLFEKGYDYLSPNGCILHSYSRRVEKINPIANFSERYHFQNVYRVPAEDGNEETYLIKATINAK
jgi:hypothetical protein